MDLQLPLVHVVTLQLPWLSHLQNTDVSPKKSRSCYGR